MEKTLGRRMGVPTSSHHVQRGSIAHLAPGALDPWRRPRFRCGLSRRRMRRSQWRRKGSSSFRGSPATGATTAGPVWERQSPADRGVDGSPAGNGAAQDCRTFGTGGSRRRGSPCARAPGALGGRSEFEVRPDTAWRVCARRQIRRPGPCLVGAVEDANMTAALPLATHPQPRIYRADSAIEPSEPMWRN